MPPLPIVRLGHPSLRIKSKPLKKQELSKPHVQRFIDNLVATCLKANGAGIASPQVGVNRRIIVVNVDPANSRYPNRKKFPLTVLVNPRVVKASRQMEEDWEGDLSADVRAMVPRPQRCTVRGWDRNGKDVELVLKGFHARVFQHEIDHLDGIFLTDRMKRVETLCEIDAWEEFWIGRERLPPPVEGCFKIPA